MAHLFIVVVYDSFNRNNVKISKTYNFPDFSFFMSQDDAHYHNHQNAPYPRENSYLTGSYECGLDVQETTLYKNLDCLESEHF